jgi:hypothetical protein
MEYRKTHKLYHKGPQWSKRYEVVNRQPVWYWTWKGKTIKEWGKIYNRSPDSTNRQLRLYNTLDGIGNSYLRHNEFRTYKGLNARQWAKKKGITYKEMYNRLQKLNKWDNKDHSKRKRIHTKKKEPKKFTSVQDWLDDSPLSSNMAFSGHKLPPKKSVQDWLNNPTDSNPFKKIKL